jgi:O-acetyl-ADP-ribose deacetylase (regulator of RNase III)
MASPVIRTERADITTMKVDAVVNAANPSLLGGGGVDGAIHRAAGPELVAECRLLGGCQPGNAKSTKAYRLPARWVIHTVGPVWHGGDHGEPGQLRSCYQAALRVADDLGARTIAFPAISTGIFGYPSELAAEVAVQAIRESRVGRIEEVILVAFDQATYRLYTRLLSD